MPHAKQPERSDDAQAALDDELIQKTFLEPQQVELDWNRELEPGEKADNAIDYEDISDDDLADDEDARIVAEVATTQETRAEEDELFGTNGFGDDSLPDLEDDGLGTQENLDDLFGDIPSSPTGVPGERKDEGASMSFDFEGEDEVFGEPIGPIQDGDPLIPQTTVGTESFEQMPRPELEVDINMTEEELLQRSLLGLSNFPPAPPENTEELIASLWPKFERDAIPRFMDLLPPKKARYIGKKPTKLPKPVQPTKINLELAPDQEKTFKLPGTAVKRNHEILDVQCIATTNGTQAITQLDGEETEEDSDYENEPVGGVSWQDFQVLCEDWTIPELSDTSTEPEILPEPEKDDLFGDLEELDEDSRGPSAKRRKLNHIELDILSQPNFIVPKLHDIEQATQNLARAVTLDLNDPYLLIDETKNATDQVAKKENKFDMSRSGQISKTLNKRYNISNDEAYDLLKENHQSRVRSTLGQPTIVHSMPAVRLQYPYYKTKLARREARSFHRPMARFFKGEPITFQKPPFIKKKHVKGKDPKTLFNKTEDLSLRDNSHMMLLEYSEEHPSMLSNFGMGSRLINYYRKKGLDDPERPKLDIGELSVLLPQDKSPFSIFGHIDAGQTIPAIYNALYKAPVFEQQAKSSDFLMIRSATAATGGRWYMRNIEYLRVVGQQFPSQEIPRPNGRKVSTAAKNRIRMIAFRLMRRAPNQRIQVPEVTMHVAMANDMQLRQKLKEFLAYYKEFKEWGMIDNRPVPDEETARSTLPPEDACLVESVQVGQQHLEDAGFSKQDGEEDVDDLDDNEESSIEQQLAPWHTTKNFLSATAGKAMLQLHGQGDPSGRGEAFSFLKTSMKGGFKAIGESVEDKLDAKKQKDLNGHSYNVAKQAKMYEDSIRRIWDAQYHSLSSNIEHSDTEMDLYDDEERGTSIPRGATPRSETQTPSLARRRDDETVSQFSKLSTDSHHGRILRITRMVKNSHGGLEHAEEIVRDSKVIRQYVKRKRAMELEGIDLMKVKPEDAENEVVRTKLMTELSRLEKNKERRLAREKQKGGTAASPGSPNSPAGPALGKSAGGTQRKCANCGQVGHIKTNKKLCPLLNGTMKQEDGFGETAFSSMTTPAP